LTRYGQKVYIIHRRDEWRAQKLLQERALNNPKIDPIGKRRSRKSAQRESRMDATEKNIQTGEESRIEVGGVFIYVGFMPEY